MPVKKTYNDLNNKINPNIFVELKDIKCSQKQAAFFSVSGFVSDRTHSGRAVPGKIRYGYFRGFNL